MQPIKVKMNVFPFLSQLPEWIAEMEVPADAGLPRAHFFESPVCTIIDDDLKKLYLLWQQLQKDAVEMHERIHETGGEHGAGLMRAVFLAATVEKVFWTEVRCQFGLFDGTIALREGWTVVQVDDGARTISRFLEALLRHAGVRH